MDEHETRILQGSSVWNSWRRQRPISYSFNRPNWFRGRHKAHNELNLSGVDLSECTVYNAFAEGLNLSGGIFHGAVFEEGDFSRADFSNATFINTRFNKTILTDASFLGASFINCNLNRVNLTRANFCVREIRDTVVYGISAWDLQTCDDTIQSNLVIERTYEFYSDLVSRGHIPMSVDNIELAQFIHYLSNHKKIRDMLNVLNSRTVLLLGRFNDGGLDRLYMLKKWLVSRGYMPMIFDFERPENMDLTETVLTMTGLARFIIADLSGGSVPHELFAIHNIYRKPVAAFFKGRAYAMFQDLKRRNPYLVSFEISQDDEIIPRLAALLPELESYSRQILKEISDDE